MDRRELENEINTHEALDAESVRIAALLNELPRVEAPGNFEFGVKARIAAGEPSRVSLIPFLKVAAPLVLLLAVGAFAFFSWYPATNQTVADNPAPIRTEQTVQAPVVAQAGPDVRPGGPRVDEPLATGQQGFVTGEREEIVVRTPGVRRQRNVGSPNTAPAGGFRDTGLASANTINPPEFSRQSNSNRIPDFRTNSEISVTEVLSQIGINAAFSDGGWKVKSTVDGSAAARSGVRSGDIVDAIDNRSLTENTSFSGNVAGKTLRVRRDGKQLTVNIQN